VRPEQTAVATGMNTVMRTIGGAFGAALTATLIAGGHGYAAAFGVCAAALALGLLASSVSPGRRHLRPVRPSPSPAP
jgi:predicted MFS family arabinose efflux permease